MSDRSARDLAEAQDGLISRAQALQSGITRAAIEHALRRGGPWQRVVPGVYATFSGPLGQLHRLRVAVLHVKGPGLVTASAACLLHGLHYGPFGEALGDGSVDVLVGHERRPLSTAFIRVRRVAQLPSPVWWVDDAVGSGWLEAPLTVDGSWQSRRGTIPIVSAARAVVDTVLRADVLPVSWQPRCAQKDGCPQCWSGTSHDVTAFRNVRALMCEVVQRNRCSVAQLGDQVAGAARRGSGLARRALADIEAGCRSAPECELRDLVRSSRVLPEPRWNQVLPGARRLYPDACWPEARLVVEVDSQAFHGFGDAPERTERKRARYAEMGWRILPVSPARLRREPSAVLREIEAAYRAGTDG